jgi:hypothetical protein
MAVSLVTGLGTLNAQALITKYSNQLRRNAILRDIYTNLKGQDIIYEGQRLAIPNGIYTTSKRQIQRAQTVFVSFSKCP